MTAQEVHIDINLGLQKVASNVYRKLFPEEIDWLYNRNENRFIASKVTPSKDGNGRFEINESSLDDIQTLVESNVELLTYKIDSGKCYSILPSNYSYLLNDRSKILTDCNSNFTLDTITSKIQLAYIKFPDTTSQIDFYKGCKLTINNIVLFDISKTPISSGLSAANEKFVLINLILEVAIRSNYSIYWETYGDIYIPGSFIVVSTPTGPATSGSMVVDNNTYSATLDSIPVNVFKNITEYEVTNRLTRSSLLPDVIHNNAFTRTIPRSPVSNLAKNRLIVHYSKSFIVSSSVIDYIRKPRKLSLNLNQSSELPETAVRKVCDMTIEYIKLLIESPAYQTNLQDNTIRME